MSNLRDAIVRMALRRPYLYLLVTLVISIVLMEVLVEIAEHTFISRHCNSWSCSLLLMYSSLLHRR